MTPGKYPITIYRGGTWFITVTAEAIDFTEYDEICMQIRPPWVKGMTTRVPLLSLTQENGRVQIVNDALEFHISAADTANLSFDEGTHVVEMIKYVNLTADPPITEEIVDKLLTGPVVVEGAVPACP